MTFRTQKISQMTPKGANLEGSDLLEVSTLESGSYVTRSITGQEIIDAAAASGGVTDVTATAPIVSTGGTTPNLSMEGANGSDDGFLKSDDWNTFNNKQNALTLTTTGTSGAATLVGATLNIPQYGGGVLNPQAIAVSVADGTSVSSTTPVISRSILIPANTIATNCILEVVWGAVRLSGTSGGAQSAFYINTTNTLTGATLVAIGANMTSAQSYVKCGRDIQKIGTSARTSQATQIASDYSITASVNSFTLNNSTDLFFLFTQFAGATDVMTIRNVRITQYS